LPGLLNNHGVCSTTCAACGQRATRLVLVKGRTAQGDKLLRAVGVRLRLKAAERLNRERGAEAYRAARGLHARRWAHTSALAVRPP